MISYNIYYIKFTLKIRSIPMLLRKKYLHIIVTLTANKNTYKHLFLREIIYKNSENIIG